jgi:hypothetical protein
MLSETETETENPANLAETDAEEKRNSGRTGPTSPEGKAVSSQNAVKHGGCAKTLILPGEFEKDWLLLLARWRDAYQPVEGSLEADFVLKAAQAEWHRIRAQHAYDNFFDFIGGVPPHVFYPGECKRHDLSLRYKNAAERTFHREYRALEHHMKTHRPKAVQPPATELAPLFPAAAPKPKTPESLRQEITVTIAEGKPQIKRSPSNECVLNWATQTAKLGDTVQRFFHFSEGVPAEFDWLFPDPSDRVPGAESKQTVPYPVWLRLYVAESLHPSGLPLDHGSLSP